MVPSRDAPGAVPGRAAASTCVARGADVGRGPRRAGRRRDGRRARRLGASSVRRSSGDRRPDGADPAPATTPRRRPPRRHRRRRRPATGAADHDDHGAAGGRPVHARRQRRRSRTRRRSCCGPGSIGRRAARRRRRRVGGRRRRGLRRRVAAGDGDGRGGRRPQRSTSSPTSTGPGVVPLPRRRLHQPGRAGRAAGAGDRRELRLAAASCQHFETGFYAAHRDIAEWAPDLVVFLGDFIYEGAAGPVGDGRVRMPRRARADRPGRLPGPLRPLPRRTPTSRRQRAACPWLVVWDDHEVENNYAGARARRTRPRRPAFAARRDAAYRAWWEHMPVRLPAPVDRRAVPDRTGRCAWGGLADLVLLDGRQFRSDQACGVADAVASTRRARRRSTRPARCSAPSRRPGSGEALADVDGDVGGARPADGAHRPALSTAAILNYDQWDGYAPARDRLLAQAAACRAARRAHRRHPPRRRRPCCPASASSS